MEGVRAAVGGEAQPRSQGQQSCADLHEHCQDAISTTLVTVSLSPVCFWTYTASFPEITSKLLTLQKLLIPQLVPNLNMEKTKPKKPTLNSCSTSSQVLRILGPYLHIREVNTLAVSASLSQRRSE